MVFSEEVSGFKTYIYNLYRPQVDTGTCEHRKVKSPHMNTVAKSTELILHKSKSKYFYDEVDRDKLLIFCQKLDYTEFLFSQSAYTRTILPAPFTVNICK